mgnify:CR=1 FL=1
MTEKPSSRGQDKYRKPSSNQSGESGKGTYKGTGKPFKRSGNASEGQSDRPAWERNKKSRTEGGESRSGSSDRREGAKPAWKKEGQHAKPGWTPRKDGDDSRPRKEGNDWKPRKEVEDRRPRKEGSDWKPRKDGEERRPRKEGADWKPRKEGSDWKPRKEGADWKPRKEGADWKHGKDKPAYKPKGTPPKAKTPSDGKIRLNKFIANSGVCSRREADMLITAGAVSVNGKIVNELGTKIDPSDVVVYDGQTLNAEKKVYVLLNKPKDYITTLDDPQGRKTVMELVNLPGKQRLFPVGRLDRNTTGLLLLTNDGELTKRLTHPRHGVRKLYHVVLDKPLTRSDMQKILTGVEIDEQQVVPDALEYAEGNEDKTQVGIELHSGQNRVVRRIFEAFDYKVEKLDRVIFAGLTKKDLPRGQWRYLSEKEVNFLKMIR